MPGNRSRKPAAPGATLRQLPGLVGPERLHETRARIRGQVQQLDAVRAVHQRMVHLAVDRESMAGEPFDDVELPQRLRQVHRIGVQARHELAELALATRVRQRRTPDVILEVRIVDDLPARHDACPRGRLAADSSSGAPTPGWLRISANSFETKCAGASAGIWKICRPATCNGVLRVSASRNDASSALSGIRVVISVSP